MFYWILLRNPLPNYHRENRISFVGMSRHSSSSIAYFVVSMLDWTLILIYTFLFHNKYWNSDLIWIMNDDDINQSLERWTFIRWMKRPLTAETMIHSFFVIDGHGEKLVQTCKCIRMCLMGWLFYFHLKLINVKSITWKVWSNVLWKYVSSFPFIQIHFSHRFFLMPGSKWYSRKSNR